MLSMTQTRAPTRLGIGAVCLAAAGLALVAVSTFLPWVVSGTVLRDSYQSISVIRAIKAVEGNPLELVLDAWTMIIPMITVCAVGYALGFRRTAATISTILAIICGTIAGTATVVGGGEDISLGIAGTGPIVMLIGAVLTVIGVVGIFAGQRRGATGDAGGEP
ncbi:MAG: hypothetical protein GEV28_34855 [Actinophytocola sp.]|uniref:hypothetical protein n=1 Tax=Actinophytocola sp. TaxID=1872138 RepID=UPI00132BCA78|nr:hypothetical protein [Actinophytocola sp.]MPZ85290.1 hypothetical protein [Actinophytocola sp.]